MGMSFKPAAFLADSRMTEAENGDIDALFELGVLYSSGDHGVPADLVEAHKWFNLAAQKGSAAAQRCRGELADEMNRAEIAEAQKLARAWSSRRSRPALAA